MTIQPIAVLEEPRPVRLPARLRGWAAVRILVFAAALVAVVVASAVLSRTFIPPSPWHHDLLMLSNLLSAAVLLLVYALCVRAIERRPAAEIGLRKGLPLLLTGAILGTTLMACVYLVLWIMGLAIFAAGTGWDGLTGALVAMFAAAVLEELLLRAVLFRIVEQATGTGAAVVVSAAIFGLMHAFNPGATPVAVTAVALEAGVAFALFYALTRNLWLVIGIHAAWNFAEGSLFGAQVSGTAETHSLFRCALHGPQLLTGGAFGPEGSVAAMAIFAVLSLVLAVLVVRAGNWRAFRLALA